MADKYYNIADMAKNTAERITQNCRCMDRLSGDCGKALPVRIQGSASYSCTATRCDSGSFH